MSFSVICYLVHVLISFVLVLRSRVCLYACMFDVACSMMLLDVCVCVAMCLAVVAYLSMCLIDAVADVPIQRI